VIRKAGSTVQGPAAAGSWLCCWLATDHPAEPRLNVTMLTTTKRVVRRGDAAGTASTAGTATRDNAACLPDATAVWWLLYYVTGELHTQFFCKRASSCCCRPGFATLAVGCPCHFSPMPRDAGSTRLHANADRRYNWILADDLSEGWALSLCHAQL
jgi:hypothetical protein